MTDPTDNADHALRLIKRKMIIYNIIGITGPILFGLGMYGLFGVHGDTPDSMLNSLNVVFGFIAAGAIIMLWDIFVFLFLLWKKSRILKSRSA